VNARGLPVNHSSILMSKYLSRERKNKARRRSKAQKRSVKKRSKEKVMRERSQWSMYIFVTPLN
jgi:hypothetical protein